MDIYCVRCGEPWDMDELHYRAEEVAGTFATVRDEFYSRGCEALGGRQRLQFLVARVSRRRAWLCLRLSNYWATILMVSLV